MTYHYGRSFVGTQIEDACPCEKTACGLVDDENINPECDQHPIERGKTIRQSHHEGQCTGAEAWL